MTAATTVTFPTRLARRIVRGFAAALAVLLAAAMLSIASPASAHGGPINAEVSQDGLGGVYVSFFYEADAHPVEAIVEATVEGRSASGETVEPVALMSASQGVGIWETASGVFSEGQWEVTVRVTEPIPYEESMAIAITLADVVDDDHAEEGGESPAATADSAAVVWQWWPAAVGVGLVILAAIVVTLVARRKRVSTRS